MSVTSKMFAERRAKFVKKLHNNSLTILPGGITQFRNSDSEYKFRQESNFYYLTGFNESNAVAVFEKDNNGKSTYILFSKVKDPTQEVWTGEIIGQELAITDYNADSAYCISDLDSNIEKLIQNKKFLYSNVEKYLNNKKYKNIKNYIDANNIIAELRVIKSDIEIELMKKAAKISADAHTRLMQVCKPEMIEYALEAEFEYYCKTNGLTELAYTSIVAAGLNACTLHYVANNKKIKNGDLVLVDAGAECEYYAADITRTFPANGKFTEQQADIYNLVLEAQKKGIEQVKPGNTWDKVQEVIVDILTKGLINLGIIKDNLAKDEYKKYYMHSSGHFLGLDVHDSGLRKIDNKWREFKPGMVLTVEPGLYIKELNIGVRIEDDILVTEQGHEILSKNVVKEIKDIEGLMNAKI